MEKFTVLRGVAAPLMRQNVDTDVIIRIDRLLNVDRAGLAPYAFEALRYCDDGAENPDFVLNRQPFRKAKILLAGHNFGCGSSREGAVWALESWGIRCIIAPSYGDIFYCNCFQNAMLPVTLPMSQVEELASQASVSTVDRRTELTVDLEQQLIHAPRGTPTPFAIDGARREALLQGLDEIGMTLRHEGEITAFQSRDRERRPWLYC